MIRLMIAALVLGVSQASAETVISYDDGSTYTLENGEEIFISTPGKPLFSRRLYSNQDVFFTAQEPWSTRDYVPTETDELELGSHEWCVAYVPWSEGYTFNMQWWQRACDTNGDSVYDELDGSWKG